MATFDLSLLLRSEGLEEAHRGLKEVEQGAEEANVATEALEATFDTLAELVAPLLALVAVVEQVHAAFAGAAEEEDGVNKLALAYRNLGANVDNFRNRINEAFEPLEKLGTYTRADMLNALAKLTTITRDAGKSVHEMGLVADLAAYKHINLTEAARLLGRILNGNAARGLPEFATALKNSTDRAATLAELLKGQAATAAHSLGGEFQRVKVALEEFDTAIGKAIFGSSSFKGGLDALTATFQSGTRFIDANRAALNALSEVLGGSIQIAVRVMARAFSDLDDISKWLAYQLKDLSLEILAIPEYLKKMAAEGVIALLNLSGEVEHLLNRIGIRLPDAVARAEVAMRAWATSTYTDAHNALGKLNAELAAFDNRMKARSEGETATGPAAPTTTDTGAFPATPMPTKDNPELDTIEATMTALEREREVLQQTGQEWTVAQAALMKFASIEATLNDMIAKGITDDKEYARVTGDLATAMQDFATVGATLSQHFIGGGKGDFLGLDKALEKWMTVRNAFIDSIRTFGAQAAQEMVHAFARIAAGGKATPVFKQLGETLLSGLGSMMVQQGQALITYSGIMIPLANMLANPFTAGPAAAIAGAALIALGSVFGSIASAMSAGGSGAVGAGFGSFYGPSSTVTTLYSGQGPATNPVTGLPEPTGPQQPITVNATIIGPNDLGAGKQLVALLNNTAKGGARLNAGVVRG